MPQKRPISVQIECLFARHGIICPLLQNIYPFSIRYDDILIFVWPMKMILKKTIKKYYIQLTFFPQIFLPISKNFLQHFNLNKNLARIKGKVGISNFVPHNLPYWGKNTMSTHAAYVSHNYLTQFFFPFW